jgi:hypothetical protein
MSDDFLQGHIGIKIKRFQVIQFKSPTPSFNKFVLIIREELLNWVPGKGKDWKFRMIGISGAIIRLGLSNRAVFAQ